MSNKIDKIKNAQRIAKEMAGAAARLSHVLNGISELNDTNAIKDIMTNVQDVLAECKYNSLIVINSLD